MSFEQKLRNRVSLTATRLYPCLLLEDAISLTMHKMIGQAPAPIRIDDGSFGEEGGGQSGPPRPQKHPETPPTPTQYTCIQLAYVLYLLEFQDPNITLKQAWDNYCANWDACFIA